MQHPRILFCVVSLLCTLLSYATAAVPGVISYQGRVLDASGETIDSSQVMSFKIYGSEAGSDSLWWSGPQTVPVDHGIFDYQLGSHVPFPADLFASGQPRWLGIKLGANPEGVPRIQLGSVPYAHHALSSDTAAWALAGPGTGPWIDDGSVVRLQNSNDRVGIGTSAASEPLVVGNDLGSYDGKYVVAGNADFESYSGFKLGFNADNHATLQWYGDGDQLSFHTRFMGVDYNNNLVLRGGYAGIGVSYPREPLAIGVDLGSYYGDFVQIGRLGGNRYSGFMCGEDENNRGTVLWYNNTNELRLGGRDDGVDYGATMVLKEGRVTVGAPLPARGALAVQEDEVTYVDPLQDEIVAVRGTAELPYTPTTRTHVNGLMGEAFIAPEKVGTSNHEYLHGVYGYAEGGTAAIGVYGYGTGGWSTSYAGYFGGAVHVSGELSKAGGSFKIDHPLDPANRYLQHSFVESPDMMNIYNGNAILDGSGEAVVTMPEWFDALNRDFRYQLTCIGGYAPVYIAEEISENSFRIAGGTPGLQVSWQVTGVRKDAWAEAHRIEVETEKRDDERGLYLHPEAFNQPEKMGIDFQTTRALRRAASGEE